MLQRVHKAHPGQFAIKNLAVQNIWWQNFNRDLQVNGETFIEAGKFYKPRTMQVEHLKLPTVVEANQEMEVGFA